ncbi:MAG: hypothetical protein JWO25_2939 [Alphaproteobacteria bacterium]|nr:hypothetical protein [Alphaproteobacteria bacterium]
MSGCRCPGRSLTEGPMRATAKRDRACLRYLRACVAVDRPPPRHPIRRSGSGQAGGDQADWNQPRAQWEGHEIPLPVHRMSASGGKPTSCRLRLRMPVTEASRRAVRSAKWLSGLFTLFFLGLLTLCVADRFGDARLQALTAPLLRYLNIDHSDATLEQLALMMIGGGLLWAIGQLVWHINKPT